MQWEKRCRGPLATSMPALAPQTASSIFYGASKFNAKMITLARPMLALNALLHLWLLLHVVHARERWNGAPTRSRTP